MQDAAPGVTPVPRLFSLAGKDDKLVFETDGEQVPHVDTGVDQVPFRYEYALGGHFHRSCIPVESLHVDISFQSVAEISHFPLERLQGHLRHFTNLFRLPVFLYQHEQLLIRNRGALRFCRVRAFNFGDRRFGFGFYGLEVCNRLLTDRLLADRLFLAMGMGFREQEATFFLVKFLGQREDIKLDPNELRKVKWVKYEDIKNYFNFPRQVGLTDKIRDLLEE
jgi:hypothetical protein